MSFSHPFFRSRWDPFRSCRFPSRLFDQDFGLPPFPEEPMRDWMEWVENRLSSSWPGQSRSTQADSATPSRCPPTLQQQLKGGMSQIQQTMDNWKISLDVKHFTPEELQVKTHEGYLEISGNHEERQDQHGFISRSFTRKYKLPSDVDTLSVTSSLTSDGILIVEAPLPNPAVQAPVEIVIPVQTEKKAEAEKEVEKEKEPEEEKEVQQEKEPEEEKEVQQEKEPEEEKEVPQEQGKEKEIQQQKEIQQEREPEKEEAQQEKVVLQEQEKEEAQVKQELVQEKITATPVKEFFK
ncbi:heat shock protein beta-1 [Heptranchias perlo]|uniref:heat shock protein beta-1 n=1 Tax=Heptranchias perlo TaxID=212740 RepID=UPI00355A212F